MTRKRLGNWGPIRRVKEVKLETIVAGSYLDANGETCLRFHVYENGVLKYPDIQMASPPIKSGITKARWQFIRFMGFMDLDMVKEGSPHTYKRKRWGKLNDLEKYEVGVGQYHFKYLNEEIKENERTSRRVSRR